MREALLWAGSLVSRVIISRGDVIRPLVGVVIVVQMLGDSRGQGRVAGEVRRSRDVGHQQGAYQHAEGENPSDHAWPIAVGYSGGNWRYRTTR